MSDVERAINYWEEFEREIDEMPHSEILEAQREPVRTALKLLRAELEREKNPLTWNERINQMTVEEKADVAVILSKRCARALEKESCPDLTCWQCFIEFFNSPYTEGETT